MESLNQNFVDLLEEIETYIYSTSFENHLFPTLKIETTPSFSVKAIQQILIKKISLIF